MPRRGTILWPDWPDQAGGGPVQGGLMSAHDGLAVGIIYLSEMDYATQTKTKSA